MSKTEFIDRVDSICRQARQQFDREFVSFAARAEAEKAPESQGRAKLIRTVFIPAYENLIQQISALGAPSGDEAQVSEFLNAVQGALDEADANPQVFFSDSDPFAKAAKLATSYGLSGCAKTLG